VTAPDLLRFTTAQTPVRGRVVEELAAGCKRTHWMWFIFPQIAGLGYSAMALWMRPHATWPTPFSAAACATMCG